VVSTLKLQVLKLRDNVRGQDRFACPGVGVDPEQGNSLDPSCRRPGSRAIKWSVSPFSKVVPSVNPLARTFYSLMLFFGSVRYAQEGPQCPQVLNGLFPFGDQD
jgi:hypothetical protein